MSDAKLLLNSFKERLDLQLAKYFEGLQSESNSLPLEVRDVLGYIEELTLRAGKRLRPAFLYYTYQIFETTDLEKVLKISMFIELVETYLLIHDDIIDRDPVRRGGISLHERFRKLSLEKYPQSGDPQHLGNALAIAVGDIACHYAFQILSDAEISAERKVRALAYAHKHIALVGYGEMLDVLSIFKTDITEKDLLRIHELKTATYTYMIPIIIGGILGGASESDLEALSNYAVPAGIAFQLQDDILGLFGSEEKIGKSNMSDLREGKRTLLIIKALEKGTKEQKKLIEETLGNQAITQEMADKVREIVVETGSLQYSHDLSAQLVGKAKLALKAINADLSEHFLVAVADYMISRNY